ncbi:GNAT family N-acetyltransferase [Dongia rigui]|uniref:GNAT family N-acetyltransferase n=1 Tax=Dongia rigui TaxID=940149 RepID=UPI002A6B20A7|nr:GNAT family N-acetyltransferase [Dongia rigui]
MAVILDTIIGVNGVVPFEVVGLADGRMNGSLATDLLAELAARATKLGARSNELAMTPIWQPHRAAIEAAGYRHYYSDYDMSCRNPAWGPDLPLPPGAAWHDAWPDWADVYIDVLTTGFADVPGAFVPKPEEIRRYLQQSGIKARILIENGKGIGLLRYTEPNTYINAVVRAGDQKGRRIGQMVMDEARRCLVRQAENDAPMTLTVVDKNTAAIELYRRCNFDIDREVAVLIRHF